jgi:hypothetical protein
MVAATFQAGNAVHSARVLQSLSSGDLVGANSRLRSLNPSMKINALFEQIERQSPASLSEVVALANAHGNLGLAMGLAEWGGAIADVEAAEQRRC